MKWLVAGVVLLVLLVAGDRVAEEMAERAVAGALRAELSGDLDIEVDGVPYLTQALAGRYDRVRVAAPEVPQAGIRVRDFTAVLSGVQLDAGDAVRGSVTSVPVDLLRGQGLLGYDDLEQAAGTAGTAGLDLSADGELLRVSGPLSFLGQQVTATAVSDVRVEGGELLATAQRFEVDGQEVPAGVADALREQLDLRLPVPALPYDLQLEDLDVGPDGVTVRGSARDLVLGG